MSDRLIAQLCEALPDAVFLIRPDRITRFCNRRAARLLGRPAESIVGRPLLDFVAGEAAPVRAYLERCARSGSPLPGALPLAAPSGTVYLRARGTALRVEGAEPMIFVQGAERQRASQLFIELNARLARLREELHRRGRLQLMLQRTLDERSVLLKEVHHRVRNNLQVITSFLSLQARETSSEPARLALHEAQARIRALGLIHGQLHAQDSPGEVEFSRLVPALCAQLTTIYGVPEGRIRFEIALPVWWLELDRAVPLALLITEAVTNTIKHAFPEERPGTVRIDLTDEGAGRVLRIADDGVGLPPPLRGNLRGSLGMRLMRALADQVGGSLGVRTEQGVELSLLLDGA